MTQPPPSDWRRFGQDYRKRLVEKDGAAQRRWTEIDGNAALTSYLEIADKVLERFLDHSIDTEDDLLHAYIIGVRLQAFLGAMKEHDEYRSRYEARGRCDRLTEELAAFIVPMEHMIDEEQYHEHVKNCIKEPPKKPAAETLAVDSWAKLEARLQQALLASPANSTPTASPAMVDIENDAESLRSLSPIPYKDDSVDVDSSSIPKLAPASRDRPLGASSSSVHRTGVLKVSSYSRPHPEQPVVQEKRLRFEQQENGWDAAWTDNNKSTTAPVRPAAAKSTHVDEYAPSQWSNQPTLPRQSHRSSNAHDSARGEQRMSIDQIRSRVLQASRPKPPKPASPPTVLREEQPSDEASPGAETKITQRFKELQLRKRDSVKKENDTSPQSAVAFPVMWAELPEWEIPDEETSPIRVPKQGLLSDDHLRLVEEEDDNSMIHELPSRRRGLEPFKQCVRCLLE